MKKIGIIICSVLFLAKCFSQDSTVLKFKNQYRADAKNITVTFKGISKTISSKDSVVLALAAIDSFLVEGKNYDKKYFSLKDMEADKTISVHKNFTWTDLLTPMFYIIFGGIWFIVFVVFAETGLFAGFFLPGDSLLFVTGIYSNDLVQSGLKINSTNSFLNLIILGVIISIAGILGNYVGYWFGRKSGPFLFERKDTFFFRKKYLLQAKEFYEKHGGGAIVMARFVPIVRTFAPIVAGIVGMEKKKFAFFNIVGCVAWVFIMLFAGHYLQQFCLNKFNFDLREHLELIVVGIIFISTAPLLFKFFFGKKTPQTAA
jgi:membrane-associated protein